jgi:hypothetical protein
MTEYEYKKKQFGHGIDIDQEIHTKTYRMLEQVYSEGGSVSECDS